MTPVFYIKTSEIATHDQPKMQTAMMKTSIRASVARPAARASVKVMAFNKQAFQAAAVGMASLALTGSAFAGANVKLGADSGVRERRHRNLPVSAFPDIFVSRFGAASRGASVDAAMSCSTRR